MIKHTYFRNFMATATPIQRDIAMNHYREIARTYEATTKCYRELWQRGIIQQGTFKRITKEPYQAMVRDLREIIKVLK